MKMNAKTTGKLGDEQEDVNVKDEGIVFQAGRLHLLDVAYGACEFMDMEDRAFRVTEHRYLRG
jgi:hypothetical protein